MTTEISTPKGNLSAAESGAIVLYRQYAKHYEIQQDDNISQKEPKKDKKRGKKQDFHEEPPNLNLKQLRPVFDCEISRRPDLLLTPETEKPALLLSIPIPCLNSFQSAKTMKNQNYEKLDLSYRRVKFRIYSQMLK